MEFLWNSLITWYRPSTIFNGDLTVAKKANGKILCVITQQDVFYEGECENLEKLLSQDDSVINWTQIPIITHYGYCSVIRVGADLFLSVTDRGLGDGSIPVSHKLYKSPSGNGGDWQLYSIVYSESIIYDSLHGSIGKNDSGGIVALQNGRLIMTGGKTRLYLGFRTILMETSIFRTSDNNGLTWTDSPEEAFYVDSYYYDQIPKHCVVDDIGNLYIAYVEHLGTISIVLYKSSDNGASWNRIKAIDTGTLGGSSWWYDVTMISNLKGGFYIYLNNESGHETRIYEMKNPASGDYSMELVTEFYRPNTNRYTNPTMQIIDNKLIITQENYVTVIDSKIQKRGAMYYKTKYGSWERVIRCR